LVDIAKGGLTLSAKVQKMEGMIMDVYNAAMDDPLSVIGVMTEHATASQQQG
jgi:hypothetical protein